MPRFRRHLAVGDPQAPFATLRAVLQVHGALGPDGRLAPDVQLVSMGDHFDWGAVEQRAEVAADGLATLGWLASHDAAQVVILAGNHDLARVCELAGFTDETFAAARAEADAAYQRGAGDAAREAAFLARFPQLPASEILARDYSTFSVAQRALVTGLLRTGRLRLAHEHGGLLLTHAAVTSDDLRLAAASETDAAAAAAGLNAYFEARVRAWSAGPLDLGHLYVSGSARTGESRGAWAHRPADPAHEDASKFEGPPRRRFDPRTLPSAFPQALGHIRDKKCRELMPAWTDGAKAEDGPLRSLSLRAGVPRYRAGCQDDARLTFLDNGMSHAPPERYQLFDLARRQPASKETISGT